MWAGVVVVFGEGLEISLLEITFLWFPRKTFTHHQLPCCPTSWPLASGQEPSIHSGCGGRGGAGPHQSPGLGSNPAPRLAGLVPATCVDHLPSYAVWRVGATCSFWGPRGLYFGAERKAGEGRGSKGWGGEGSGEGTDRAASVCPDSSSPALPSPQGLLANSRRCRLLPQGPHWHFHAFCAAL